MASQERPQTTRGAKLSNVGKNLLVLLISLTLVLGLCDLNGGPPLARAEVDVDALFASRAAADVDFAEVKGQAQPCDLV